MSKPTCATIVNGGVFVEAKTHPLVKAVIDTLPAPGAPFPTEQRAAWLKMVAMAFDVAYGVVDELPAFLGTVSQPAGGSMESAAAVVAGPVKFAPKPVIGGGEPLRYFIDINGNARCEPGGLAVRAVDIPRGETLWDERPDRDRSLDTVTWADGTWPAEALPQLTIAIAP